MGMDKSKSDKHSGEKGDSRAGAGMVSEFEELRQKLRDRIDELDEQILKALNERAQCAIDVGVVKKKHGQRLFDPKREERVLRRLVEINGGPLANEAVLRLFERIIDESRRVERIEVYDKKS
jgi:chorismate mutase